MRVGVLSRRSARETSSSRVMTRRLPRMHFPREMRDTPIIAVIAIRLLSALPRFPAVNAVIDKIEV